MNPGFSRGLLIFMLALLVLPPFPSPAGGQVPPQKSSAGDPELARLVPQDTAWPASELPRFYLPESLFEYIDGAAESYIGYDFRRLVVAQFARKGSPGGSLTVEIYDMGEPRNAFGIYGAERYPDSHFIATGTQGYYEEGSLNFLAGRFYVKLMCYDCGSDAEKQLTGIAAGIAAKVPDKAGFPPILSTFPKAGLVADSEKFILRNFQGLAFLGNGYQASYKVDGLEFECFIVESPDASRAEAVTAQYLDNFKKAGLEVKPDGTGSTFRDKYLLNVFVARSGRYLCGVSRIPDGREELGRKYLDDLVKGLSSGPSTSRPEGVQ